MVAEAMKSQHIASMPYAWFEKNSTLRSASYLFYPINLQDELVVAGIYVRIYNQQPGFTIPAAEAADFCKGLVVWIKAAATPPFWTAAASDGGAGMKLLKRDVEEHAML